MQKSGKITLLIFLMLVIWLPLLQGLFGIFNDKTHLKGAYVEPEKPEFVLDSFMTGNFQKRWDKYEDYNFGFRAALIKGKNAAEYILFTEIDNPDLMEGRNGFLYSQGSADRTMKGRYYNGKERNENTVSRIKFLQEGIEKRGGHLAVIIVPSKESIMPENLPSRYDNAVKEHSDYEDFVQGYRKNNIPFIDLRNYFQKLYPTSPYQLFTKTGFHWSTYGASIAQDTILKYSQSFLSEPMPRYIRKGIEWSDTARDADADFEDVMNLPFSLQQSRYAYPKLEMDESTLKNHRPKAIIIGDSFFWQIKNQKKLMHIFSDDSKYWYYFRNSFPLSDAPVVGMEYLDITKELESADFVFLVGSMGTLGEFPFGVADYYFNNFNNPKKFQGAGQGENIFYLKAANNKYVSVDGDHNNLVIADRDSASSKETFSLLNLQHDKCAISSYANKFFSAELAHQNEITANREGVADWETFMMVKVDSDHVAFKAVNGKYLSVDEKSFELFAKGDSIGRNEKFEMIVK